MCDNFVHAVSVTHMQSIVALLWRIATFKAGPETIPFRPFLATSLVVINIATASMIYLLVSDAPLLQAVSTALVGLAVTAGLTWALLSSMGHKERFMQTLTAMVGTNLIVGLIQSVAFPITQMMSQTLAMVILLATTFWAIAIYGFIFHRALNIHAGLSFGIAFIFYLVSLSMTGFVLPQT